MFRVMKRRHVPRLLLSLAAAVFGLALVATLMLLLAPDFPLWEERGLGIRIGLAGVLVGLFGIAGFVLSLAAGVAEVELIFPRQHLAFEVEDVDFEPEHRIWELRVINGDSHVTSARVEASAWGVGEALTEVLEVHQTANWHGEPNTEHLTGGGSAPWYPGQRVLGPRWKVKSEHTRLIWHVRWWTDRETGHDAYLEIEDTRSGEAHRPPDVTGRLPDLPM